MSEETPPDPPPAPPGELAAVLDDAVERTLRAVGPRLVVATPLGLGKPNLLVDAFYRRALDEPSVELTVYTALALARPRLSGELERRLAGPVLERILGDWPDLRLAADHAAGRLPERIRYRSFFYPTGRLLRSPAAQRDHVSLNYTRVVDTVAAAGANVLLQAVATSPDHPGRVSLSSNPDLTLDLLPHLEAAEAGGTPVRRVAQRNGRMPWMYGDAVVGRDAFDEVLEHPGLDHDLFALPAEPVGDADWAIGLHASLLVRDGGTIQLGIGALGDAVSRLLLLRHRNNATWLQLAAAVDALAPHAVTIQASGGTGPFDEGLHGSSEMLMPGLLELFRGGVLTREAEDGHVLHGGFYLGTRGFYEALRSMPDDERRRIGMTRISYLNRLLGDEDRKRRERRHARFLNTGMVATLLGAVASDGLDDGRVVSGVGGQHDFVTMAQELEGARSIILLRAVRERGGRTTSNVRFSYGHCTIPRHLRDVVVTEYGIADLRGRTDEACVQRMLQVADSRFQEELLEEARDAGKVDPEWEIPRRFRDNTPERLARELAPFREDGTLAEYPFGSDLTPIEQGLSRALRLLKRSLEGWPSPPDLGAAFKSVRIPDEAGPYLERMGLADPEGLEERVMRRAVAYGLAAADVV